VKLDIKWVKTLYSTYKVIYQKKVILEGREKEGVICYSKSLFRISTRNSLLHQLETIMHEYYHAIFTELEIEPLEEREVNALSRSLVKFIQENPELIKVILEYKGEEVNAKI